MEQREASQENRDIFRSMLDSLKKQKTEKIELEGFVLITLKGNAFQFDTPEHERYRVFGGPKRYTFRYMGQTGKKKAGKATKAGAEIQEKVCERCGKTYRPSMFTPYQKYCSNCGRKRVGGEPKPDREDVKCSICGKTFSRSKFLPYRTLCPDCIKAQRKLAHTKNRE